MKNTKIIVKTKSNSYPIYFGNENLTFETMINNRTVYPRHFSRNSDFPLLDFWYNYNNFTFNKQYYWELEIPMKDYEFYYLQRTT